jgi:hypothetical protein
MSIKQNGGVFGRNPTFNDVTIEGDLIINGEVFTGLDFQGSWNASTNSPALASSVGTNGEFYIVSVAGTTNLNGITNWGIGDWAIFNGTAWQRVEGGADGNFNALTANSLTVAGTATMDGLTVDGESDLNATVTITHANPRIKFIENDTTNANTQFSNDGGDFAISTMNDAESTFTKRFNLDHATGDISFYEDTGTTAKFFWDASAEALGIGTSSPASLLTTNVTADGAIHTFSKSGTTVGSIGTHSQDGYSNFYIASDNASFDVGIGFGNAAGTGRAYFPSRDNGSGVSDVISIGTATYKYKDLYLSGGVVFGTTGGSVTSKTLDDYEEGTWTPVISDAVTGGNVGSATTTEGFYTKVGQVVNVYMFVSNIVTTGMTAANLIYFRGLPFATASTNAGRSQGNVRADQVTFTGYLTAQTGTNVSHISLSNIVSGNTDIDTKVQDFASGGSDVFISLTYRAA